MATKNANDILWECLWGALIGGLLFNFPGALCGVGLVLGVNYFWR
jgi:hypothetical protein